MVFLHIVFMPAPDTAAWLSHQERDALNARYAAAYDTELSAIENFNQARSAVQARVAHFMRAERASLIDGNTRHRITIAPFHPEMRDRRPYTSCHVANDTLVSGTGQLFGAMAWAQVMSNTFPEQRAVVAMVHVFSPCSEADKRRAAFVQTASLRGSDNYGLQSLAAHTELLQLIGLDAVPLKK
jgi:hypothetical protein